ncbi:glutamine amidotransferase [Novimethylophilus kurashikiensis]|uniref:Glutamine amidotransferase n=1 Tax=Novimethylophilus kurashikiensis TaxID=1825523 RepID=A0A2R5FBM6_9PROT|nr:type 1 glutamine amidotransferase [Novimethylophilus kurashikiensis]GBG15612.1 glutamine amidotransferase [Novimethylophilus kurashikiensis]
MKPIAIFRHARTEGPGHLATFLDQRNIPWQLICIDEGDALPDSVEAFSGLVFMGGPMSVNDDLPWIPPVLALIRSAVAADIPVLGHCLGGQLMSKALGGSVGRNPVKEIGWGVLKAADNAEARRWFGDMQAFTGFHWHGETFTIPERATRILASDYCDNQAFSLGKHLGFQCHIEMTEPMIREWCDIGIDEIQSSAASPGVQKPETVFEQMPAHLPKLNSVAARVYEEWIQGLKS